jgi:hypothetical protein
MAQYKIGSIADKLDDCHLQQYIVYHKDDAYVYYAFAAFQPIESALADVEERDGLASLDVIGGGYATATQFKNSVTLIEGLASLEEISVRNSHIDKAIFEGFREQLLQEYKKINASIEKVCFWDGSDLAALFSRLKDKKERGG